MPEKGRGRPRVQIRKHPRAVSVELPEARVRVSLLVSDGARSQMGGFADGLEHIGLRVGKVRRAAGLVTGYVAEDQIGALRRVPGVVAIEVTGAVQP